MRPMTWAAIAVLTFLLAGCNTGVQTVKQPKLLVAPPDKAVVVDAGGHCLGYVQSQRWFASRLKPGQTIGPGSLAIAATSASCTRPLLATI